MSAIVIPIHVHVVDTPPDGRAGTFTRPHALVRVKVNTDTVQWMYAGNFDSFTVQFVPNPSPPTLPFPGVSKVSSTAGPTPALTPTVPGNFHYTVEVIIGGVHWSIDGCPEIGVDL